MAVMTYVSENIFSRNYTYFSEPLISMGTVQQAIHTDLDRLMLQQQQQQHAV